MHIILAECELVESTLNFARQCGVRFKKSFDILALCKFDYYYYYYYKFSFSFLRGYVQPNATLK